MSERQQFQDGAGKNRKKEEVRKCRALWIKLRVLRSVSVRNEGRTGAISRV